MSVAFTREESAETAAEVEQPSGFRGLLEQSAELACGHWLMIAAACTDVAELNAHCAIGHYIDHRPGKVGPGQATAREPDAGEADIPAG